MKKIFSTSLTLGGAMGLLTAGYIFMTVFREFDHDLWLFYNNLLIIGSLLVACCIGIAAGHERVGVGPTLVSAALFFGSMMMLYVAAYVVATWLFADQMAWIPFFYRDYQHHGFRSVQSYLDHNNNFRDLLLLQIFSICVASVMYLAATFLGYFLGLGLRIKRSTLTEVRVNN